MPSWKNVEKYQKNSWQDLVELWADNDHLEVRLTSLGHIVHVGLVDNLADREWPTVLRISPRGAPA